MSAQRYCIKFFAPYKITSLVNPTVKDWGEGSQGYFYDLTSREIMSINDLNQVYRVIEHYATSWSDNQRIVEEYPT